jgi:hypothetical protein
MWVMKCKYVEGNGAVLFQYTALLFFRLTENNHDLPQLKKIYLWTAFKIQNLSKTKRMLHVWLITQEQNLYRRLIYNYF